MEGVGRWEVYEAYADNYWLLSYATSMAIDP